jgi:hypothetical protein
VSPPLYKWWKNSSAKEVSRLLQIPQVYDHRLFFLPFLPNQKLPTRFLIPNIPKPTLRNFVWVDMETQKDLRKGSTVRLFSRLASRERQKVTIFCCNNFLLDVFHSLR